MTTEDLFKRLYDAFSRTSYGVYEQKIANRLPYHLLAHAGRVNASIAELPQYDAIRHHLAEGCNAAWRNAEVYPYLNYICRPDNLAPEVSLKCLQIHLGLEEFEGDYPIDVAFLRLRHKSPLVYRRNERGYEVVEGLVNSSPDTLPLIYRPHPHLFDDVSASLYRGNEERTVDSMVHLTSQALSLIDLFCPDLSGRLRSRISCVAFIPKQRYSSKSYSFRNHFIGGVFVSIASPPEIAEQLIHEYYHQQIWPWWLFERPVDLPSDATTLTSPVTGATRAVPVLFQAFLIYASVCRFYAFLIKAQESLSDEEYSQASGRLDVVAPALRKLGEALSWALRDAPRTREQLEFISAIDPLEVTSR